jgi:hypothetical protein
VCGMLPARPPARMQSESPAPESGAVNHGRVRTWIVVGVVAACWAVLRLAMNREYGPASWDALVELRAPLPFGHRVLVPLLAKPFVDAGAPVRWAFGVSEWWATIALLAVIARATARDLPPRAAALGAVLVLPVLALPMLLAHRWNVFYPWDTWAMVAWVLAVDLIRREQLALCSALVFVGAFNRESVALVPMFALALRLERGALRTTVAWAVWMGFAYALGRGAVAMLVPARGAALHLWLGDELRLVGNLRWLADPANAAQWLGSVACLPIAWWSLRAWTPRDLMRLHVPLLVGLCGLLVVANAYEPRVYGELVVVAWLAVWIGAWRWATGVVGTVDPAPGWIGLVDRTAGAAIGVAFAGGAWWIWAR